jgi:branched-chain amino acid aminotransferase
MHVNEYICLNGEFHKASDHFLDSGNRAFRYGDALSENIHASSTEPQFLEDHLERLTENMQLMSMNVPGYLSEMNIRQLITQLLNKNRLFGGAGIRLTVYRILNKEFIPDHHDISFLLESFSLPHPKYDLNDKGLTVEICQSFTKYASPLSNLHSANKQLYLLAGLECKRKCFDEVILMNQFGRMVETVRSNVFLESGKAIFTPGIDQGCIAGIMRKLIVKLSSNLGYVVNDQSSLTPAALNDAEEVFLTNSIDGIRWVGAYRQIRYFNKTARLLTAKLNEKAFKG